MKVKYFLGVALLLVAGPSMAGAIWVDLGLLSVPGSALIGNTFDSAGTYTDQYQFSIDSSATASGLTLEFDLSNRLGIDVTGISLTGTGGLIGYDSSASLYNFGSLGAGTYTLSVFSSVFPSNSFSLFGSLVNEVGYVGVLALGATKSTSVPEPAMLGLFGIGLVGVALATRRRRVAVH